MAFADQGRFAGYLRTILEALPQPTPLYCLVGALAVNAWGRVRSTRDIDLLMLSDESTRVQVVTSLGAQGFQVDALWMERNPTAKDRVLRLKHASYPGIPLDLMLSADSHEEATLARRTSLEVWGVLVWICSPEDLVLMKLKASRPHDFEDALTIVKNPHRSLDLDYLWSWADRIGLQGELHYVLQAAGGQSGR
jgi:hypothetical protein